MARALSLVIAMALTIVAQPVAALEWPEWLRLNSHAEGVGPPRPVVTEIVADNGTVWRWIPGTVASKTQVDMGFQSLGRMTSRLVDIGDRVEEGQLLAELATDDLMANTRAVRAAVDAAEVQLSIARTTFERTHELSRRNVASDAQLEQAMRGMAAASAAAEQARSQLVQAEDAEGHARMLAPFAGVVSAVYEAPGAVVGAGAPVLQLAADDGREAVIDLPEYSLAGLPPDAVFTVWQRSNPDSRSDAVLSRIEPLADMATRTRRLYLTLPPDAPFRLGALIRAHLGSAGEPALSLPAVAVLDAGDGGRQVWRVRRDAAAAHVEPVTVTTGVELHDRVVIRSGLEPGDEIVVRGVNALRAGQAVGRKVAP